MPSQNFSSNGGKYSGQCRNKMKQCIFFLKKILFVKIFYGHIECSYQTPPKNFQKKLKSLGSMSGKERNFESSSQISSFLKMLPSTLKMQFWEPCQNFLDIRPNIFRSMSVNVVIKSYHYCSSGNLACTFDTPAQNCFDRMPEVFWSKLETAVKKQ